MKKISVIAFVLGFPGFAFADLLDLPEDKVNSEIENPAPQNDPVTEKPKNQLPSVTIKPKPPRKKVVKTPPKKKNTTKKTNKKKTSKPTKRSPIEFTSEGARATKEKGVLELKDNVRVVQDDFRLKADNAKAYLEQESNEVKKIIATGNIEMFKVDSETGQQIKAYGDKVTFEGKKQIVILEGNARLFKGKDLIKSDKITYDMNTGWITSKKVKGVIQSAASDDGGGAK